MAGFACAAAFYFADHVNALCSPEPIGDGVGFQEIKLPFDLQKMCLVMNKLGKNQ